MPESVKSIAKEIGADKYAICGNGTLIYDLQNNENIYNAFMDKEKVLDIIKVCEENSIYYNVYTENEVLTKSLNYNTLFYDKENSKKPIEKRTNVNVLENVYKYIEEKKKISILKMTICDENKIVFSSILRKLKNITQIDILEIEHMSRKIIKAGTEEVPIEYYYTEIAKKNTNKWSAIEHLINLLGINKEEVMTIGDNANDQKMVEKAGLGVAMGNSMLSNNKIGTVFVSDNDHNGVAEAINRYINYLNIT
jgi:hypothetical protein